MIGKAFHFKISLHLRFYASNNALKFLTELIAVWLGALDSKVTEDSYVFSSTDNTSAVG